MKEQQWDTIISSRRNWFEFRTAELWAYRDLITLFVRRDFVAYYKQTILGPLWFFIQPIFTMLIFMIVFGRIAQLPTEGIPPALFYLAGIVNWTYFSECINKTSNTFIANTVIFGKVYFPRLIIPFSIVMSNLISYGIQLFLFLIVLGYYLLSNQLTIQPGVQLLIFPLLILQIALFGLGMGLIVSSLTTKYKDLSFLVVFGVQLAMYATPVVYPLSRVPLKWLWVFSLNPMASVIEAFRSIIFNSSPINWPLFGYGWTITLIALTIGISLFNRVEKTFMDTV